MFDTCLNYACSHLFSPIDLTSDYAYEAADGVEVTMYGGQDTAHSDSLEAPHTIFKFDSIHIRAKIEFLSLKRQIKSKKKKNTNKQTDGD